MTKDDLLLFLCKQTAVVPRGYDSKIYSIPRLARQLNVSQYRVQKLMKELEADGAVEKGDIGGCNEDEGVYFYHGWSITEKTRESELYRQCDIEALHEYKEWVRRLDEEWEREHGEDE